MHNCQGYKIYPLAILNISMATYFFKGNAIKHQVNRNDLDLVEAFPKKSVLQIAPGSAIINIHLLE